MSSSYSNKQYQILPDDPDHLLVDFSLCDTKSDEIFIIDNTPPEQTQLQKFVQIRDFFDQQLHIKVPTVTTTTPTQLIVQNLGHQTLLYLGHRSAKYGLFQRALEQALTDILPKLAVASTHTTNTTNTTDITNTNTNTQQLFDLQHVIYQRMYDGQAIYQEMSDFIDQLDLDQKQAEETMASFNETIMQITQYPFCLIHRDFQSANLILHNDGQIYPVDFQDACLGPRLYDMASLLYDLKLCLSATERKRLAKKYFTENDISASNLSELHYNALVRLSKSISLRLKQLRKETNNLTTTPLTIQLIQELKQGIVLFKTLQLEILGTTTNERRQQFDFLTIIIRKLDSIYQKVRQLADNLPYTSTVILGAGQGKRMGGQLPKVLQPCLDKPMIEYAIRTAQMITTDQIYSVVGYKKESVISYINHNLGTHTCTYVTQAEQKGTGHAVMQVMPHLPKTVRPGDLIVIISGDVPVLDSQMMSDFLEAFLGDNTGYYAGILTTNTPQPEGCGRIIRADNNDSNNSSNSAFIGMIEDKDIPADRPDLRAIREISTGTMVFRKQALTEYLFKIDNDNAQSEYYLPDVVNLLLKDDKPVLAHNCERIPVIHGANNREQLKIIEDWMKTGE